MMDSLFLMRWRSGWGLACRLWVLACFAVGPSVFAQLQAGNHSRIVYPGTDGKLVYVPNETGDTVPDFSNSGYMGGGVALPQVPVRKTIEPEENSADDLARLQGAIDEVAKLPADASGFRGAVLLKRGTYRVHGTLKIAAGGVVLRGEGPDPDGTVIRATMPRKHTVIELGGTGRNSPDEATRQPILDERVPAGGRVFRVADPAGFKVGDKIIVHRPSTSEWLTDLKMDRLTETYNNPRLRNWRPGGNEMNHYRQVTAIDGDRITIDAPILQAIEKRYGGGSVVKYRDSRIEQSGVEDLRIVSIYDPANVGGEGELTEKQAIRRYRDEDHAWIGIVLNQVRNGWVSRVSVVHTGYGAVHCGSGAIFTTVRDCAMIDPVSQHTGGRKYSFAANGQMGLFMNCYSRNARHDFVLGSRVVGPNVFLDCLAEEGSNSSEPHHRYAVGCLWDNVKLRGRADLQAINRGNSGSGHGWSGAQMVFWNCAARALTVMRPPGAQNYAIGWDGPTSPEALGVSDQYESTLRWVHERSTVRFQYQGVPMMGDGHIESPTQPVSPRSLYLKQLEDRLGPESVKAIAAPTTAFSN